VLGLREHWWEVVQKLETVLVRFAEGKAWTFGLG
jgi:hypothetical protein